MAIGLSGGQSPRQCVLGSQPLLDRRNALIPSGTSDFHGVLPLRQSKDWNGPGNGPW
jgi:hypothetical protein